jgi:hypothetical protein
MYMCICIYIPYGSLTQPWYRWPIEIDGLPFLKMVDLSIVMLVYERVHGFSMILY